VELCSAVGTGDAKDAAASFSNIFWAKSIGFGQIWLDMVKI